MNQFKVLAICAVFFSSSANATIDESCRSLFYSETNRAEFEIREREAQEISREVTALVEMELTKKGMTGPQKRGYAILIGSMVGSAALTTYLGSHLSSNLQFLSVFLAQVSTLGVYVLGAPIWEPLSSKFRLMAFGVRKDSSAIALSNDPQLESTWLRTQEGYSLNAQMSRNVISQFVLSVKQNFYEAHRAYATNDSSFAADQIAEAAFRLKTLYKDIKPNDVSVQAAVNTAFTNHIPMDAAFVHLVWSKLEKLDANFDSQESRAYYGAILQSWLKVSASQIPV